MVIHIYNDSRVDSGEAGRALSPKSFNFLVVFLEVVGEHPVTPVFFHLFFIFFQLCKITWILFLWFRLNILNLANMFSWARAFGIRVKSWNFFNFFYFWLRLRFSGQTFFKALFDRV